MSNEIKFELKEDKIIDILMHAATREDINKLDLRIDRLDTRVNKLDSKIDRLTWLIIAGILIPIALQFIKV